MIGFIIIAIIIGAVIYGIFGWVGLLIAGILIVGIIVLSVLGVLGSGSSSSSSSRDSLIQSHGENRKKYPNKCISCTMYLSRGICRQSGKSVSEMDSCSNWC